MLPAAGTGIAKSGLLLPVMSSVLLIPVSVAAVMSGAINGAAGAVEFTVIGKVGLWDDSLPATSSNVKLIVWLPLVIGDVGVSVLVTGLKVAGTFTPST